MNRDETRIILIVIAILVLVPVLVMPLMMFGGGMMGGWAGGNWGPNAWWGWLVTMLFWVLLIGGLVAVVAWIIRRTGIGAGFGTGFGAGTNTGTGTDTHAGSSHGYGEAMSILNRRYARGEIDREQYERIKQDLTGS